MKQTLYTIITLFFFSHIQAQEQVIPDPYLKVIRTGGMITLSLYEDEYSITFPGDTVYRLEQFELMVVIDDGLIGIVDPWDLYVVVEPVLSLLEPFDEETILVKKKGKYYVMYPFEFSFKDPLLEFDSIYPFTPPGEVVYNDMHMYILENKGKFGLYNTWYGWDEFIPVKYDEIKLLASHEYGIVYKLRKGKKWGAGDCESYETKIAYDDIDWLIGSCQDNYFRVRKDGKSGLVATWNYGDYVYPPEFDKISFAGTQIGNGYFILKKGDKWDVVDDSFPLFEPRYDNVHIVETEGLIRISMEADGDISTLEIEY